MQIEVKNLKHIYSPDMPYETLALDNVSLTVKSGEFLCLIGHTGSGKTTLVQHIAGIIKPTSGSILLDGIDTAEKTPEARNARRKIGIVFQYPEYQLFEETVLKDVCFGPKNMGLSPEECEKKALESLTLVGLNPEEKKDVSPFELSGGEKRRVAIAGVLAMDPQVLILDEPTAGLDPAGHDDILNMIKTIRSQRGITIILVSHNMDDVAELADHVVVMEKGRILAEGTPEDVFSQAKLLRSAGLDLPSVPDFLEDLTELGMDTGNIILDFDAAADFVAAAYKKKHAGQQS